MLSLSNIQLPSPLISIASEIKNLGGQSFLVGGWVRDYLLGVDSKDFDIEVYRLSLDSLISVLKTYGRVNEVGKAFGVITMMIQNIQYDFAFPRTESKTGKGHKGFMVTPDPNLTFEKASSRRDFTINAMGIQLPSLQLSDMHNGVDDLKNRLLRHVSSSFSEDPLRALRAIQFSARFNLNIHPATQKMIAVQPLEELPKERIFEEVKKLLLKAPQPSIGFNWMRKLGLLRYFPELKALIGVPQDPVWHPEGDVWEHNCLVIDSAAQIRDNDFLADEPNVEFEKLALMLGALCHDFGKPSTTQKGSDGRWRSPAHANRGEHPTRKFLSRLTNDKKLIERVVLYVLEHLKPAELYKVRHVVHDSTIRRLSLKIDINKLVRMAKADHFGRTTPDAIAKIFPAGEWLIQQSEHLKILDSKPKPLLTGKMLLKMGMQPGPAMGKLIDESFDLQLEGQFHTLKDVLDWAQLKLSETPLQ